ncbi:hypothetical protein QYM36_001523 [Artemia franciscana]|uniref:Endonuclease/exonuclease/phosphatase domain-containing protein n=1 Tax=Artemia franciscana TaxID=6661 RepID=A0AA88LBD2_ARTSF|nr:hypothetical protein QYM36_001523 [Artemia franciscana]
MALTNRVLDSSSRQVQKKALISSTPVSERKVTIRLKGSVSNLIIIQVYATDTARSDKECEQFYFQLQSVTDQTPKKDMLIVMGDFNAITDNDQIDRRDVMGPHGHGRLNGRDRVLDSSSRQVQKKALISSTPVSERKATIRLKGSVSNLTIIQVYATDTARSDKECEQFYFQLQSVTDQTPKKDMLIVMGDFNAITDNDQIDRRDVMGPHGHGRLNGRAVTVFKERSDPRKVFLLFPNEGTKLDPILFKLSRNNTPEVVKNSEELNTDSSKLFGSATSTKVALPCKIE